MKKNAIIIILFMFSISLFGISEKTYMENGSKLYAQKKYSAAFTAFEGAASLNPKNAAAFMYMGYCRLAMKDRAGAAQYLEKSYEIKKSPALKKYIDSLKPRGAAGGGAYYYNGSYSRMAALGAPELTLRDASSAFDMYGGTGFASGLVLRPRKNLASAITGYFSAWSKSVSSPPIDSTFELGGGGFPLSADPVRNYSAVTYWLTNSDVLNLKLFYMNVGLATKMSGGGFSTEVKAPANVLMTQVEYSRLIFRGFSAGVYAGYNGGWFDEIGDLAFGALTKTETSQIEWGLSASYVPELAASAGKVTAGLMVSDKSSLAPWPGASMTLYSAPSVNSAQTYIDLRNIKVTDTYEMMGFHVATVTDIAASGVNVSLAGAYEKDNLELLAGFGMTAGIGGKSTSKRTVTTISTGASTTTDLPAYSPAKDGSLMNFGVKGRYRFGIFTLGLGVQLGGAGYKYFSSSTDTDPTTISLGYLGIAAGTTMNLSESLLIPVEFKFENNGQGAKYTGGESTDDKSTIKASAGCEYKLSRELALRAGLSFSTTSEKTKAGGVSGPAPGTADNPNQNDLTITLGAGYAMGKIQLDGLIGYTSIMSSPLPDGVDSMSAGNIQLLVGGVIPF